MTCCVPVRSPLKATPLSAASPRRAFRRDTGRFPYGLPETTPAFSHAAARFLLPKNVVRATELLEKDHARIDDLFAELDRSGGESAKNVKRIFGEIMQEIELHSELVQRFLYPVLLESSREPLAAESAAAQEETAALLRQIGNLEPGEAAFDLRMADLRSRFRDHSEAERTRLAPFVESRMSHKQLEDLGTLIEAHRAHRNSGPKE